MYDKLSPPKSFLTSYISSCSHPVRISFNSPHLVIFIYLIPITSRVRISPYWADRQTMHILLNLNMSIFFIENIMSQSQTIFQIILYISTFHLCIHSLLNLNSTYLKNIITFNIIQSQLGLINQSFILNPQNELQKNQAIKIENVKCFRAWAKINLLEKMDLRVD